MSALIVRIPYPSAGGGGGVPPFSSWGAYVQRLAAQSINVSAAVSFDTEIRDDDSFWAAGAPTRLTVGSNNWYLIGTHGRMPADSNGRYTLTVRANGATALAIISSHAAADDADNDFVANVCYHLAATEYAEVIAAENVIGAKNLNLGAGWIGRLPSAVGVYATSGSQTMTTAGTRYPLAMNAETVDDDAFHDNATNNTRLTTDTAGWHLIGATASVNAFTGRLALYARKNAATDEHEQSRNTPTSQTHELNFTFPDYLSVSDYYEFELDGSANSLTNSAGAGWMVRLPNATGARVKLSSTQTLAHATDTALPFGTEVRDDAAYWDAGQATRLVAQEDGWHFVGGRAGFASDNSATRRVYLRHTKLDASTEVIAPSRRNYGVGAFSLSVGSVIWMEGGEYIEVMAYHDEGIGQTMDVTSGEGWILALS